MGKNNCFGLMLKGFFALFFALFFFYPLASILMKAFSINPDSFSDVGLVLWDKRQLLWNSFSQAGISTFFALAIGLPAAFVVARRNFFGKNFVKALSLLPFVFPSILVVLSFVIILGNNGWVNSFLKSAFGFHIQFLYGFSGIVIAHVFYNFPIVMRFVSASWEQADASLDETAKSLGAGRKEIFLKVTLPQLLPSIIASASLVFIFCFMSFAIVLALGGIQFSTFEVEIYRQILRELNLGLGAILSVFQFAILSAVAFVYFYFSEKLRIPGTENHLPAENIKPFTLAGFFELLFLLAIICTVLLPVFAVAIFAFIDPVSGSFTLNAFEKFLTPSNVTLFQTSALDSIVLSLVLASISSILAVLLAVIASLKQAKSVFVNLMAGSSMAVSIITLAFGYFLAFGSGQLWVIAIGHAVLAFPFALRAVNLAFRKIGDSAIDAAHSLGADSLGVFLNVQLPLIKKALFVAFAFSFAISLGELGLVLVLYDGVFATMPVYIYRLIATYDLFAAGAMGFILICVSFVSFYAIEYFSKDARVF